MTIESGIKNSPADRKQWRVQRIRPEHRKFIAWDGEGQNLYGPDEPQSYVLFGCSTGDRITSSGQLSTLEIVRFLLEVGARNPTAIHVGFAFNYDVNMIVQSLTAEQIQRLYEKQYINLYEDGVKYVIRICRSKWMTISRHEKNWKPRYDENGKKQKSNYTAKQTVKIYDIFSFFNTSFVKAARAMLGDSPELRLVAEGKKHRGGTDHCPECEGQCLFDTQEYMVRYWEHEIKILAEVATELRRRFLSTGMKISSWYGPGALASWAMKKHGIKKHMADPGEDIKRASQYGYAGGRFELYKVGRIQGPIYSYDFNSAYPHAISLLPSLGRGKWVSLSQPEPSLPFSIHNLRFRRDGLFPLDPGPLFYRDRKHCISYPWTVQGWYWHPEAWNVLGSPYTEYGGGYAFIPDDDSRPFDWVRDMYAQRQQWKAEGNTSEYALKLTMNSMYGKMAQRVGWDERKKRIPPWHQLEWAGWVTAYTRGRMWQTISKIPIEKLIAVETDGFYTTMSPTELGITDSKGLGEWGVDVYDEMVYFQSGLAWVRQGETWTAKRRGLDPGTFELSDAIDYAKRLGPVTKGHKWEPYIGGQTRFIGMGAALARGDVKKYHCRWETTDKHILPGAVGKRVHVPVRCHACQVGATAWEMAHDLAVTLDTTLEYKSQAHYVPWLAQDHGDSEPVWVAAREIDDEMIEL